MAVNTITTVILPAVVSTVVMVFTAILAVVLVRSYYGCGNAPVVCSVNGEPGPPYVRSRILYGQLYSRSAKICRDVVSPDVCTVMYIYVRTRKNEKKLTVVSKSRVYTTNTQQYISVR